MKIITKQEILDDMHNRAAICDFHVLKQKIIVSMLNDKNGKHSKIWNTFPGFAQA